MSIRRDSPPDSEADLSMENLEIEMITTNDLELIMDGLPSDLRPQKTANGDIVGGDEAIWYAIFEDRRRTTRQIDSLKQALEIQSTAIEELELENEILKQGFDALMEIHDTVRQRFDPLQRASRGSKDSTWTKASAFFQEIVERRTKMKLAMEDPIVQEDRTETLESEPKDAATLSELS